MSSEDANLIITDVSTTYLLHHLKWPFVKQNAGNYHKHMVIGANQVTYFVYFAD